MGSVLRQIAFSKKTQTGKKERDDQTLCKIIISKLFFFWRLCQYFCLSNWVLVAFTSCAGRRQWPLDSTL